MKKFFTLTLALMASICMWAADPDLTVTFDDATYANYIKAYTTEGITLTCYNNDDAAGNLQTAFKGNLDGHYYVDLGKSSTGYNHGSFLVEATLKIDSISIFWVPNNKNKDTNMGVVGWKDKATTTYGNTVDTLFTTTKYQIAADKTYAQAKWETLDFSKSSLQALAFSRKFPKNVFTYKGSKYSSNFGEGQTVCILGVKVWLHTGPTLKAIKIAGVDCDIIALNKEDQDTISGELPYGTVISDAIAAITSSNVTLGGSATSYQIADDKSKITVSDGTASKDYIFNLTVSTSASTDATLKSLSLNDVDVELEDDVYEYDVVLPYTTSVTVDYVANHASATASVDKSVAGKVTITVTAQAGNHQDYVVNYTIADAPKSLTRALFSNGFDAFIDTENKTVKAYYLAETATPTLETTEGDGEAAIVGNKIVVTAADSKTLEFDLTMEAVTPNTSVVAEGASAGTFTGTETWIKAGLHISAPSTGYTSNKYILRRQLKNSDSADDQRVIAGWVRAYFFVGNASSFELTQGSNKGIKYAVDGGEYSASTDATSISIPLEAGNHMIEVVTTQNNGNCELTAPKLVERIATALNNTEASAKAVKRLENGQLIIEKNGVRYNAMGQTIR